MRFFTSAFHKDVYSHLSICDNISIISKRFITLGGIQFHSMENQNFTQKLKQTAKKTIKIIFISALVLGIITFSILYWGSYSTGVRSGVIVKVSKKGFVFKTYEGQLNLETFGAAKGGSVMNQTFDFSIDSDN